MKVPEGQHFHSKGGSRPVVQSAVFVSRVQNVAAEKIVENSSMCA